MSRPECVDLAAYPEETLVGQCQVCIVGAGAAGLYLAAKLVAQGLDVVLLEAGGTQGVDASAIGFAARFDAEPYPGATAGRFFGLGGSSSRWGGLLIPHTRHDVRDAAGRGFDEWRHIEQTVSRTSLPVLRTLGWQGGDDFSAFPRRQLDGQAEALRRAGLEVSSGLFLPFRQKNLAYLLKKLPGRGGRLRVIHHAVVQAWQAGQSGQDGRVQHAEAVSPSGRRLKIAARHFIIAAGALESARILLELEASSPQPLLRGASGIGCYLADHLSVAIADVRGDMLNDAIASFAPRFSKGWMRNFRFLEANPPAGAPRAFAHFIFENKNPGFALAKEALAALQGRRWPTLSAKSVGRGMGGLLRLGAHRYLRSALYIPPGTETRLQLDIEQVPLRENGIRLGDELDRYGRRVGHVHWRIDERDGENLRLTAKRFLEKWPAPNARLPTLSPRLDPCGATKPHDAYHPVGTCRMGKPGEAVVDENLKVHGMENLWVVSTGVLPSAGTANPTFTMLCLADSLAGQLTHVGAL